MGGWAINYMFMTHHPVEVHTIDIDHEDIREVLKIDKMHFEDPNISHNEFLGHELKHK